MRNRGGRRDRPLGVGLVGCGEVVERHHLAALAQVRELELVALADPDPAALERCASRAGVGRRYSGHEALSADPAVEVVGVCAPAESHVEVAAAALAAGRHVLIEKPPALGLDEWDRLIEVGATGPCAALLGVNMRRLPSVMAARELIGSGALGEVRAVQTTLTGDRRAKRDPSPWRADRLRGGGALVERAVHHLDLWRFLLDSEVDKVQALAGPGDEEVCVTGRMESGVLASTVASDRLARRNEVHVAGTRGRLRLLPEQHPGLWVDAKPTPRRRNARESRLGRWAAALPTRVQTRRSGGAYLGSFAAEWRDLAASARSGTPAEPGLDSGRRLLQTVLAAAASASTGTAMRRVDAPRSLTPPH